MIKATFVRKPSSIEELVPQEKVEDSYVSGVCKFKAFNTFDYIAKYFKTGALKNARAINDTKTIWFIDKEWNNEKEN